MLLTPEYCALNRALHRDLPHYGTSGKLYVRSVQALSDKYGSNDILDYGCGKRTLQESLGYAIHNYDPCVTGFEDEPIPHDIVVCTDVLEHIEPQFLGDVIADIRRCAKLCVFFAISTVPAKKFLSDGRNAHLTQEGAQWWLNKMWTSGFDVWQFHGMKTEVVIIAS